METKANYVAVGAFVLICVIGLVVTLLWLASTQYAQEFDYYQSNFKGSVSGLGKGTLTRYNGIEVGRVTDLTFDPNDPQSVIVTMQVQPGLKVCVDTHPPIVYPMVRLRRSSKPEAAAFASYLDSPAARAIFERYGFRIP